MNQIVPKQETLESLKDAAIRQYEMLPEEEKALGNPTELYLLCLAEHLESRHGQFIDGDPNKTIKHLETTIDGLQEHNELLIKTVSNLQKDIEGMKKEKIVSIAPKPSEEAKEAKKEFESEPKGKGNK